MSRKLTKEEVIKRINEVHPNRFTYDNFVYSSSDVSSIITCVKHGDIEVIPRNLFNGQNCSCCSTELTRERLSRTKSEFIAMAKKVHGDRYNYDNGVYINNVTSMHNITCNRCGKSDIKITPNNHLKGHHHQGCKAKKNEKAKILRDFKKEARKMSKEWQYTPDWSEEEMMNGSYCGYVYLFQFEDGTSYVGSKQIYKRVKDYKKIKPDSVENGWRDYSSSSKIVNQKIADGEEYTKTILWCFPTMKDTLLVETALIVNEGLKPGNLNLSIMHKARLPTGDDKKRLFGVLKELLSYLN